MTPPLCVPLYDGDWECGAMAIDDPIEAIEKQYPRDQDKIPNVVAGVSGGALTVASLAAVPHLAIPIAAVTAWSRLIQGDAWRKGTEETQAILVERLRALEPEYERLEKEQKQLRVEMTDMQSAIQIGIVNDGTTFDDRKRERFVSAIANATVSPSKVRDLVSFIQDIDQLNESDIAALKVLNRIMNRQGDWDSVTEHQAGLHPNTFLQRRHELAVQMAVALGKTNEKTDGDKFSREEGLGACLRLQGFGLAEVITNETRSVPRTNYCARPTTRGLMLLHLLGEDVPNWGRYFDEEGAI
jgi:hypothetical protein